MRPPRIAARLLLAALVLASGYDPFGAPRPGSSVGVGIGYGGEYRDGTGLLNLRARSYDPALGRFLGRDTFGGLALAPQTANRYAYALANPLRYRDPSGHFVTNIVANPRAWLGIASFANPWVAIGLGFYIADTGYDPVFNATVSPEGRAVAGISSLLGVAGKLGSRFMEAWRATETGAEVLTASERLLLAETSIQRAVRLGSEARALEGAGALAAEGASSLAARTRTTRDFLQDVARRAEGRIGGAGPVAGTLKHSYAERLVNRYQGIFGDVGAGLRTERSYLNGMELGRQMNVLGSVRLDVVDGPVNNIVGVFDFKFTIAPNPVISQTRISTIRSVANLGPNVPIVPIHP